MTTPDPKPLWTADEIAAAPEVNVRHPWNENSDVHIRPLSAGAGLSRVVLSLARVPPGKESFVYHSHERDEEFLFILSGRGRAEIGDETFEVGPGDFMGFTAPGVAHHLTNPYQEDLVYLMGGERSGFDIGHFPKLGRRIIYAKTGIRAVDEDSLRPMALEDFIVKS
ncbi:cupin domain-containing protein [Microvirga subterranea]|uniref:Putative cupin superfamily protein n=1 Tax=Microvirga subterranea TaxID=186651 RepID=A0A370HNE0_9HYPH|nr:cupin domain-containing protein [Microvirga subterranea]RDI59850.1 putative cupin superfamily protein [Microvirga subterranea]